MINPQPKPVKAVKPRFKFPKKRKQKTEKQKMELEADRIIKAICMIRDEELCCCPSPKDGHSKVMQAGHLITRASKSVRWDLWNVNIQCSSCNMRHEHKPELYTGWFIEKFGGEKFLELTERSRVVRKIPEHEMRQLIVGLNALLIDVQIAQKNNVPIAFDLFRVTQEEIIEMGRKLRPNA